VPWQRQGQAALLDCEPLLDDVLLRAGDYRPAPVGTAHHVTETDTGTPQCVA
jgi:hypothetical protein